MVGRIHYGVAEGDRLCAAYDTRDGAIEHIDGVEAFVGERLDLVTLQVIRVELGSVVLRQERDTLPAPAPEPGSGDEFEEGHVPC